MDEFLEGLVVTGISIILVLVIVMSVILGVNLSLEGNGKIIGTNMNNETKEYVRITYDNYGVTEDGTRELLKFYKYKK